MRKLRRIDAGGIGPITRAEIEFGDLTVFVGPQATGKSIVLQLLKLLVDRYAIHQELRRFSIEWRGDSEGENFLSLYFGEGMAGLWNPDYSALSADREGVDLIEYARGRRLNREEKLFFIPAQRVLSVRDGATRPFTDYRYGDPYVLREFSEKLHQLIQNEFGPSGTLFPQRNRLNEALRRPLTEHIFGGFNLETEASQLQRRIVLRRGGEPPLPYLVWSAGQREFVPLLLGLYWLMPPSKTSRRGALERVVIEEPEMGLHPSGLSAVMNLVLELVRRSYRVSLSTHSPHVLDIVWALRFFQQNGGQAADVLKTLGLSSGRRTRELAESALASELRVYYFSRDGTVRDISDLDPGAEDQDEAGWGGLTEFSGQVGDVVAEVAARNQAVGGS